MGIFTDDEQRLLEEFWTQKTCGEIVAQQEPVVIDGNLSVEQALQVLISSSVLSAPVFAKDGSNTIVGFLTYRLLVEELLRRFEKHKLRPQEIDMRDLIMNLEPKANVADVVRTSGEMSEVRSEEPLRNAVRLFGQRVHRTAVLSDTGDFQGMLSQGILIKYLFDHGKSSLVSVLSRTLLELGMIRSRVLCISSERLVIEGVKILVEHNISSIAIINENKRIIGNLSLADVKYILRKRQLHMFFQDVKKFLGHVKSEEAFDGSKVQDSFPVFTIHSHRPLRHAIELMVVLRTHRLWIIEQDLIPKGVISITDVMRVLTPELPLR